jgi:hypothetical protein
MSGGIALDAPAAVHPDACRRFLHERGDVSLGLVPQLLLDEGRADLWALFWFAARHADDDIEARRASPDDYARRIWEPTEAPADRALARFLESLPGSLDGNAVRADLERALRALGRERSWTEPPTMTAYAETVRDKAGVPLVLLNRLLLEGEDAADVERFSHLLAFSIQLGDDLRDRARDQAQGLHTITEEEFALARAHHPEDPDPFALAIVPWREAAAQWLGVLALERAERFRDTDRRAVARLETLLWLRAIETGQLRDHRHPMRWPSPLGDLLAGGPPTAARMAAARRVVHHDPDVLGELRKWDARHRLQEMQRARRALPELYSFLDAAARPPN